MPFVSYYLVLGSVLFWNTGFMVYMLNVFHKINFFNYCIVVRSYGSGVDPGIFKRRAS